MEELNDDKNMSPGMAAEWRKTIQAHMDDFEGVRKCIVELTAGENTSAEPLSRADTMHNSFKKSLATLAAVRKLAKT
eukprot:179110-Alexandrium_andersonii.AAC.1